MLGFDEVYLVLVERKCDSREQALTCHISKDRAAVPAVDMKTLPALHGDHATEMWLFVPAKSRGHVLSNQLRCHEIDR